MKLSTIFWIVCIFSATTGCVKKQPAAGQANLSAEEWYELALLETQAIARDPQRHVAQALWYIDRALSLEYHTEWIRLRASLLLGLGRARAAGMLFKELVDQTDNSALRAELINNYACALALQGDHHAAVTLWSQLTRSPVYRTPECAWYNIARVHAQKHNVTKAYDCSKRALTCNSLYLPAHRLCAHIATQKGDVAQAAWHMQIVQQGGASRNLT